MIIGITGSIGSGKTTVASIFSKQGFLLINADEISHSLIRKNRAGYRKVLTEFGDKILDKNMDIDRKKLGDIVFNDARKLDKLNSLLHPSIGSEIRKKTKKSKNKDFVLDIPLLIETNAKNLVDKIVLVKSDKRNIFSRLRKKYPREKIEKILKNQMPFKQKLRYADFVVKNDGNDKGLEKQVLEILKKLGKKK